ncbi:hypothetical protein [Streptomyces sp. NBC_00847]|uniref:hypothetical protein n=1 Tax=unclassified Streptomyces TaxID=2593676 RepID=UPI002255A216|nr:hypothetical protein [Streptomyces sp. NBC_00847]MCX4882930.1 hypothetical protein [Streptomyces sp. NBC_00847]
MVAVPSPLTLIHGLTSQYPALKYEAGTAATWWERCECRGAIPFGIANFKLIPVSLLPLGREIVRTDQPFAAR